MKYGLIASKELADFLRERSNVEENNWKLVNKLAKQAGGCCTQGTFAPLWVILRTTAERLASLHLQMVQKVGDLVKDISKYAEELHKKHKAVKEEECGTLEAVQAIQSTSLTLQKAKDSYTQKGIELDKLKKESASPKELEKAEQKLKKAQEEYKTLVDKYSTIKEDFENKMSLACKHFQEIEEVHIKQMKDFLTSYADLIENNHDLVGKVHVEFKRQCLEMTVDKLLEQFVLSKCTGLDKPGSVEIKNVMDVSSNMETGKLVAPAGVPSSAKREGNSGTWDKSKQSRRATSLLNLFLSNSHGKDNGATCATSAPTSPISPDATTMPRNPLRGSKYVCEITSPTGISAWTSGFLRSRRDKRKEKKAKKKKEPSLDNASNKEERSDVEEKEECHKSKTPTPEVDDEGYCIQPKVDMWENDKGSSFYSSSDSVTDDDRERKIRVEIKPISNGSGPMSASVDELRATVENISLSPLGGAPGRRGSNTESNNMKRSQSVSQQIGGKLSNDLVGLSLAQSPTGSSASTPTGNHPYAPLQSPTPPITTANKYSELGDLFSEVGDVQSGVQPRQRQIPTPTSTSSIAIPRPPSRRSEGGVRSPIPGSLGQGDCGEFRTSGVPVGTSRGPSPLTIGMADTIPLAVAFHEIIHCYFKGTDETKCQVKICGDMMLSFPAGIVTVLANNPNPAQLSFVLRNANSLENVLPNKQLINCDSLQPVKENSLFEFNMSALTALLRRQSEQNPSASYFNVDILKYQVKPKSGAESCPLHLVAYWKCEKTLTDLKIDYKYNSHAMCSPTPLINIQVSVPIEGGVKSLHSKPSAHWVEEDKRALWRFVQLSQHSEKNGVGSLRARLEVTNGPNPQGTVSAQFSCEGATLSGVEFQLVGYGYRLSLIKRRFMSGEIGGQ
ncbi:hypothetical protein AAG570_012904 [Ranatra chinensis]|uniref:F-BAR domain only protein 2 n=1 Tax=Ranatra chinensis TaxID=642074 RepID=A0ABD0YF72_9HEMI